MTPDQFAHKNGLSGRDGLTPELVAMRRRASAFYDAGHLEPAIQLGLEVVTLRPDDVEALLTIAHALREQGRLREALGVLRRVLELEPDCMRAHAARALTLFWLGSWEEAWRAYDIRFRLMDQPPKVTLTQSDGTAREIPHWQGGKIPAHLLVLGEQGLGDTIQFVRFLPLLLAAGTKVTCVVQHRLLRLLGTLDADIDWRPMETGGSVPGIKGWLPLMHLPQVLNLPPERFIPDMPYLRADPELVANRRAELGLHGFRIGIAWQGNPDPRIDGGRSVPLAAFAPLARIPGVRLVSLQQGAGTEQTARVGFAVETPQNLDVGADGFVDTAAVMLNLDLVVTVDTSLAHLAGALAVPTFILLKRIGADWRWLQGRDDTIWYPTVRLFRQHTQGDWAEVLERVTVEVLRRLGGGSAKDKSGSAVVLHAPIAVGELIDKITILEIKAARFTDPAQLANVQRELGELNKLRQTLGLTDTRLPALAGELKEINTALWDIEEAIRQCEARADFGECFASLARRVYLTNDQRARVKQAINLACGSHIVEEKSYGTGVIPASGRD